MEVFPLNLVLAVAAAAATIFLGFLPARNIRSAFFAQEILKAAIVWVLIAMASPPAIRHYHFIIAFLCFASWWQLRRDRALGGKMWLSIASGLGISIGVMLILAVSPLADPPGLSPFNQTLLLASTYLGGAVVGLAYVCYVLTLGLSGHSGITAALVQRYVGLLGILVLARVAVLAVNCFSPRLVATTLHDGYYLAHLPYTGQVGALLALDILALPILTFDAMRATRRGNRDHAAYSLIAIGLVALVAESLARLAAL